ncbi:MAG: acetyl/propionyl/methylcrotonyl-CoA carboxylase subunit alpha [Jatrophihabitans sp.]
MTETATPFDSVLVANRGEIARRVLRSCRELGLATVAVFADPDAGSPHLAEADCAVRLPGASAAQTYLRAELIVQAALRSGAGAVHPGYGFLAESAEFARAVEAAGLVWIGPPPQAIELLGSKIEAKRLMAAAGVPVLAELDPDQLTDRDLPVLIKASAGGGGRGMRVVTRLDQLAGQLADAAAAAERAFGDPAVFCERYLPAGRHLEVQVLADRHGTVWAVGERECSIQRRHQKVIEEAPSPLVERIEGLRERLVSAALAATGALDYVGAGTVEFVADYSGRFYFLETSTRLQVEHPVTECTTGLDLVRLQLQIAAGARLPARPPVASGHAIEARLYAEDPAQDWQPQSGTLHRIEISPVAAYFSVPQRPGVRLDSGVTDGSQVSVHYDPMLAKVICSGTDRAEVARVLARTLANARIHGLITNRDLLVRVLRHPAFLAGELDADFLDLPGLREPLIDPAGEWLSAVAAALAGAAANRAAAPVLAGLPSGWRNVGSQPQRTSFQGRHGCHRIDYRYLRSSVQVEGLDDLVVLQATAEQVRLQIGGLCRTFSVARYPGQVCVDSALGPAALAELDRLPEPVELAAAGSLLAPMPGAVLRVGVEVGQRVEPGQPVVWIEAMKMEHPVRAPAAGVVGRLLVQVGDQVGLGTVLVVLDVAPQPA